MAKLVVLLRAVAPSNWGASLRVLAAVREVAPVPVTVAVVPRLRGQPHDLRFDEALGRRVELGDELALHGYLHEASAPRSGVLGRLWRSGLDTDAEFRDLGCDEALQRLHAGMRWFAVNGWPLSGFVAPRWSLGPGAWAALALSPLQYTLTRHAVHLLPRGEKLASHSIEHRVLGRVARQWSLAWNEWPGRLGEDASPLLRLELTPRSADHPSVCAAWQACLRRQLCWRQVLTLGHIVQSWPPAGAAAPANARGPVAHPPVRA